MHVNVFMMKTFYIPDICHLYFVMDLYLFAIDKADELNVTAP